MDIDLELPSGQDETFDVSLHENVVDGTNTVENAQKSFTVSENAGDSPGLDVCENIADCRSGNDGKLVRVENVNKSIMIREPQKGLEFETKEEAYSFYREYARSVGFGITIKASRRSKKSGKFIDVKIACSRFGNNRKSTTTTNMRTCVKTNCKASMHMKRREDGKWFIYNFMEEHNHEICQDDFYYAIRGRNKQPGNGFGLKKGLQLALDDGDVQILLENLTSMQAENPGFWYSLDFDREKRMRNVFWVDAKGRHDYGNFCDVVFFDTNYVCDNYKIPFVPIIGVNNHFQVILLGCALIGEETVENFIWLMRTWLRAIGGQIPGVVITDEDKLLVAATAEVFPEARHCFYLWNLLRKIPENLSQRTNEVENFMVKFKKCIYRSWTVEEFEKRWWKMVNTFGFQEDEWIQSLYDHQKKWIPTFMGDTFLAGLCTTERSESISSFFDKYIHRETTVKELINNYKVFLHDRYEEAARADTEMRQKQPTLRFLSPFGKQLSDVYTPAVFEKFQVEVMGTDSCKVQKEFEDESTVTFRVDDLKERQNFIVVWNEAALSVHCLCRSFEYRGFLCRHALIVLQISGVSSIPSHYILKRWTKDAKIRQPMHGLSSHIHSRLQRLNDLCRVATKLGEEGSLSWETCDIAFCTLEAALKHCVDVNNSARNVLEPNIFASQGYLKAQGHNQGSNVARASKKKKVQKKRKEPESRMPITDGHHGAEHSVQRVRQFNPLSSIRDGYYTNQKGMEGLEQLNSISTRIGQYGSHQSLQGSGQLTFRVRTADGCFDIQGSLNDMFD